MVQYAVKPEATFCLNSHKTKKAIMNAIDQLGHKGGRRLNTGAALQFVRNSVFTSEESKARRRTPVNDSAEQ